MKLNGTLESGGVERTGLGVIGDTGAKEGRQQQPGAQRGLEGGRGSGGSWGEAADRRRTGGNGDGLKSGGGEGLSDHGGKKKKKGGLKRLIKVRGVGGEGRGGDRVVCENVRNPAARRREG